MAMSKVHCEKLLERAHLMGMDAGRSVGVTPMVVGTPTTLFGSEIDYSKKTYFVEGGVCGFAGVVIKPARGKFVSYLKSLGMGHKHYYGRRSRFCKLGRDCNIVQFYFFNVNFNNCYECSLSCSI